MFARTLKFSLLKLQNENESLDLQAIITECKGQPFSICLERYLILKESSSNLKDILTLILMSFPRDLDTFDCLYSELFCMDPSKNLVSLVLKNHKGLTHNLNGEEQDLVSLLMIFLQKILKLTERSEKSYSQLKHLRTVGSLLLFFPVETKIMECRILIQKVLEHYKAIKKEALDLEHIELLALISFGMNVYVELLAEEKDGHMEEESYFSKLVGQFKEDIKDYETVFDGLMLKVINSGEEKLTELYEIICRILHVYDPEHTGMDSVCEKFTRKVCVHKTSKTLGTSMLASLKEKFVSDHNKKYIAFWRDNLLLEVLRMSKDNMNAIIGSSGHQVYLEFLLKVAQPYRDYEYKILQRILSIDFSSKKEDFLILRKMHHIVLSEDFFKHIHMNLFLVYYSLRMADLAKKNGLDKDFHNIYFSKVQKIPILAYLRLFEKVNKEERFSGREARTQKKFQEELTFLLLKYFEFFFLPFSKLKLDSFKFENDAIERLVGDSYYTYEKNFEEALKTCLNALQSSKQKNNFGLEKKWQLLFHCDPVRTSQNTFLHFLSKLRKPEAYQPLMNGSFLDPLAFLLLEKELFRDTDILKILLQSLNTQLSVWEMYTKETAKGNTKKYLTLLKNTIVHYMIEIIGLLNKPGSTSTASASSKENIAIMCEYIHIFCVEDTELIENIIREGFEFGMVACLVDGVEWMHACLFFADELLQTKNYEKKVLYIMLLSYIIKKYPTMKTYSNYALAKRLLEYDMKIKIDCSQIHLVKYIKDSVEVLVKTFSELQRHRKDIHQFYSTYTLC